MTGTAGTGRSKVYFYYKCTNAMHKKTCDKKAVKKDWIERAVVFNTTVNVLRDDVIDKLADEVVGLQKRESTTIPFLQRQLAELDKKIENILKVIEDGVASASLANRLVELESTKADIEIAIAREKIQQTPLSKEQIVFWISRFKNGNASDPAYQRSIADIFVNAVFLYDDHIGIGFNWRDGQKTITLAELEITSENNTSGEVPQNSGIGGSYLGGVAP